ncbi:hypothetical protein W04_0326 [Pseudoalteromonas sp. SW0106-04]|nr:hypothetical protein W04_0326 [Pseudoalteromonas sp. SW0106-04]
MMQATNVKEYLSLGMNSFIGKSSAFIIHTLIFSFRELFHH